MKQKWTMPTGDTVEKEMPVWKTPYNHDTNFESDRTALYCADESRTKQEFKDDVDINTILERFTKTKEPPPMVLPEHFADLTTKKTYFEMESATANANEMFYKLPAQMRAEFLNDPTRWADQVVQAVDRDDPDALEALGVQVNKKKPQAAQPETPVPGGTPAPGAPPAPSEALKPGGTPVTPSDNGKK